MCWWYSHWHLGLTDVYKRQVEYDGEKVGAYRDEEGEIYLVSAKCPHLGCQLEWNPDEKCFECPCHGSRFDHMGHCVDGPAQTGIALAQEEDSH